MQPRRLSRAAGKLCRKHAWNARSKQKHVPDIKQVLLWKGWVLKQRLSDVQSRVGATATRAHVESPLRTEPFVNSCSVRHQGNWSTREIRHREMFMRQDCCTRAPQAHLDLSPCAKRHVPAKSLLRSHTASTLGSLSARQQDDMFMRQTVAFARHNHTWISLRGQRDMFRQNDWCVLTPRAHLDLGSCAKKHAPSKRLLQSRAAPKIDDFYLRTPDPVSTVKRAHVPYAIGNS